MNAEELASIKVPSIRIGGIILKVERNKDDMSVCNDCLDRHVWAETIIVIGGMSLKLCQRCRKELMTQLIDKL